MPFVLQLYAPIRSTFVVGKKRTRLLVNLFICLDRVPEYLFTQQFPHHNCLDPFHSIDDIPITDKSQC